MDGPWSAEQYRPDESSVMPTSPSPEYLQAQEDLRKFDYWLSQQRLPYEPSENQLKDLLEEAFLAGARSRT